MKHILRSFPTLSALALSLAAAVAHAGADAQTPRHLDPLVVSIGRELGRGAVVSYDSRQQALEGGYGASRYLQPLEEWTRSESSGAVTFKTSFKVPFEWIDRRQFLCLSRVSGSFDVVVNGTLAGYSQTGSTPSEFDVTELSGQGINDLEIVVYKDPVAARLEDGRPHTDPNIEGEVYILSQPRMRVRDIFISTRTEGTDGLVELGVIMKSHQLNPSEYTVFYELISPRGETLVEEYKEATLDMRREDTVRFFARIPRITPWSHEEPCLYTLFIKTRHEGRFKEHLAFQVGFRSLDPGGDGAISLNGVPLELVMRDYAPTSDMAAERVRLAELRSSRVNSLRLRGAPPRREFYALCDELGLYLSVQADIDTHLGGSSRKVGGNPSNDPAWEEAYLDRVISMYHTSKNSPSVVMFSLAENSANGYNLYESYLALKALERHRPVIYTDGGGEWNTDRVPSVASEGSASSREEWAALTAIDAAAGRFAIRNTRRFTPLAGEAAYTITVGRKAVSEGVVPLEIAPGGEADVVVPIAGVREGRDFKIRIEVRIQRPVNKYVPGEAVSSSVLSGVTGRGERRVFRDPDAAVPDSDKITITSGEYPVATPR